MNVNLRQRLIYIDVLTGTTGYINRHSYAAIVVDDISYRIRTCQIDVRQRGKIQYENA